MKKKEFFGSLEIYFKPPEKLDVDESMKKRNREKLFKSDFFSGALNLIGKVLGKKEVKKLDFGYDYNLNRYDVCVDVNSTRDLINKLTIIENEDILGDLTKLSGKRTEVRIFLDGPSPKTVKKARRKS